jgi:uncharacterized protein (TIGR03067 family)
MIPRVTTVFVVCVLLAAQPPQSDAAKEDLKKLQGGWKVEKIEAGGMELKDIKPAMLTFKDNTLVEFGKEVTFKIDPSKKPKEIDLVLGKDGKVWMGVYDLDGDKLKLSLALVEPGKLAEQKRPTDFDTKKPQMVFTLTRAKP